MKNIIEVKNLSKSYKELKAVDNISFEVRQGEVFSFLGINGAGKSTTINIISGILSKDKGEVIVDGYDIDKNRDAIKSILGIVFQTSVLDNLLTVEDNLKSRASLYNIFASDADKIILSLANELDFADLLKRPLIKLSGGQKRRIDIARALIHNPKILILDEPTTGLDPQTRILVWNFINKLRKEKNITVFLTTHYMEEASESNYVVIIDNGHIVAKGTPNELKNRYSGDFIKIFISKNEDISSKITLVEKSNYNYIIENNYLKIEVPNPEKATELILKYPQLFIDYEVVKGKMDDVFLKATGKSLKEMN